MKLAFWRRAEDIEPLIDVRFPSGSVLSAPASEYADLFAAEYERNRTPTPVPVRIEDLQAQLAEVTVERDELLQALDEKRPEPAAHELGQQLKAAWYLKSAALDRSYDEAWTAVAETAIDAVRGLWPTSEPLDPADIAVLDAEADRLLPVCGRIQPARTGLHAYRCSNDRDHDGDHCAEVDGRIVATWTNCCGSFPFCGCPTQTSPGAPGQRSTPPATGRGLGSAHAPGDTNGSAVPSAEPLAPAEAPTAGTSSTEAAAPSPAGPPPSCGDWDGTQWTCTRPVGHLGPHAAEVGDLCRATWPSKSSLAAEADEHMERLALRLAVSAGTVTSLTWNLMTDSYREVYRTLATQVVLAGWLPPGTRRAAGNVGSVAAVLTDHELLADDTCRCGWPGSIIAGPMFHAEHQAQQLLSTGVLA